MACVVMGAFLYCALIIWELAGLYFMGLFAVGLIAGIIWPRGIGFIFLGINLGQAIGILFIPLLQRTEDWAAALYLYGAFLYNFIFSLSCLLGSLVGAGIRWMVSTARRLDG